MQVSQASHSLCEKRMPQNLIVDDACSFLGIPMYNHVYAPQSNRETHVNTSRGPETIAKLVKLVEKTLVYGIATIPFMVCHGITIIL